MRRLVTLAFLAFLSNSCSPSDVSELKSESCAADIQSSGLPSRLKFCELKAPSIVATTSCITATLEKLQSMAPSCRIEAARSVFDNNLKLITFHAERLSVDAQGAAKASFAPNEIADFVRVTDLFFSTVKSSTDSALHRDALLAMGPMQEKVLASISLIKRKNNLEKSGDILNRSAEELLGVTSETLNALNSSKNIETLLPFALPALASTVDQLELSHSLSQLYCDLGRCDQTWTKSHEMIKLFAMLGHSEDFEKAAIAAPAISSPAMAGLLNLFRGRTADLRAMFRSAAQEADESTASLSALPIDSRFSLIFEIVRLLEKFERLNERIQSQTMGSSTLNFALDEQSKALIEGKLVRLKADLSKVRSDYDNLSMSSLQNSLEEIQTTGASANLKAVIEAKEIQRNKIAEAAVATQDQLAILESNRARYILSYHDLASTKLGENQSYFKRETETMFTVSPRQAAEASKWPSNVGDKVSAMSALPAPIELKAGQSMNLQVTGEWSPTCALKKSRYSADLRNVTPKIGPSGYQISVVNDKAQINARTISFSSSRSNTNSSTLSQNAGVGLPIPVLNLGMNYEQSYTDSSSTQNSFSRSQTEQSSVSEAASFSGGLRLPNVPFPTLPAGALLVYRVPANSKLDPSEISSFEDSFAKVDSISVVQTNSTLTAETDSRFFFIVNDCLDASSSSESLSIQSTIFSIQSTESEIQAALIAMNAAVKGLESQGNEVLKEGGSIQLKLAASVSRARASLNAREFANLPAEHQRLLQDYLASYIDYVFELIQRRLELKDSLVQIKVLNKEIESYGILISSNANQTILRNLQSIVIANNLQLSYAYPKLKEITEFLRFQAAPQLKLHNPRNYRDLLASLGPEVIARESQNLSATLQTLENLADLFLSKMSATVSPTLTNQRLTIALSFPRPGADLDSAGFPKDVPIAGEEISKAFWDLIFKPRDQNAFVTIDPAQIFEAAGQNRFNRYGLGCSMAMPVINNMGLFLYTSSGNINEADMNQVFDLGMQMGPELLLPTRSGPQKLRLAEREWGNIFTRAHLIERSRFHQIEKILAQDEQLGLASGKGLSPFSTLSVNDGLSPNIGSGVDALGYPADIDVITLAFLVDVDKSAPADTNLWISSCN